MQLGTRWDVGDEPRGPLAAAMRHGIQRVESELLAAGIDTAGWRWTLTWLERRPIAELDDGTRVVARADGSVAILPPADEA